MNNVGMNTENNMDTLPSALKYTDSHVWIRLEADSSITVGITNYAQQLLGDIVLIELPSVSSVWTAGAQAGVVESVKVASDIYVPVSGTVIEVNETLLTAPEKVNQAPYAEGWLFRMQPSQPAEWERLLSATAYAACIDE